MIVFPAEERGATNLGWLKSRHTFSFGEYFDPARRGFGYLRVINEDVVAPAQGFGTHAHRDMEIMTYVIEGALEHKDSLGSGGVIRPGEVQLMSAGRGITHSEFNASRKNPVHFLQIWITPREQGLAPSYAQRKFDFQGLALLASPNGRDGSLAIHQDVEISMSTGAGHHNIKGEGWIQVIRGEIRAGAEALAPGDGLAIESYESVEVVCGENAEALIFIFDPQLR